MASLTYQQYNTKTLTGLSDTYSNNINCDTITIADNLTCSPGCVITLPPASIQDSYLTANVAFRNQVNNFTLDNNFASTTTHNGTTTNNGTTNFNSTVNVNNGTIQNYFATNGSNTRLQHTLSSFQIINGTNSQAIILSTRTSGGSPVSNLVCQNGNTAYLQGDANNRVFVSGSTTPTITIQAPLSSNNLSIANTAWVVSQAYAKLAGPQTFTGDHNFPTQATGDNSTLVATTAFVKNQGYAVLGSSNVFLGSNNRFESFGANLPITIRNTDVPAYGGGLFIPSGSGQYNANNQVGDTCLLATGNAGSNSGALSLTVWSSTPCGIRITNNAIAYTGTNHNFNGAVNLPFGSSLNILNSGSTRGMQIQNDNTNGGLTLFRGVGVSTRFNFFSNDGAGTATNNFYISSGNTCYLQGATGLGIGMVGSAISLDGICSFTNTTTPVITQTILTADNSTKIATTAWVRLQNYITTAALSGYALLAGPQTFTGNQNFPTQLTTDNSTLAATTAYVKNQNYITSSALSPYALLAGPQTFTGNQNFPTQLTTDNSTLCATTAFVKNQNYITSSALTPYALLAGPQTFTGNQNFPTQLTTDNSTLAATTAYVKNQNYITTAALSGYALLNPVTTQTFGGTGDNVFSNIVTFNVGLQSNNNITLLSIGGGGQTSNIQQNNSGLTIRNIANSNSIILETRTSGGVAVENIKCQNGNSNLVKGSISMLNDGIVFNDVGGGSNSTSIYQTGTVCTITNNYNSGSVRLNTKTSGGAPQDNVYALNGNQGGLQGNSNKTIQVVGNDATVNCDTFNSFAPYTCGYNTLGTLITKTNNMIGYTWSVQGSSFNSWNGFTSYGNVYTIVWDGTGDKTYGVWRCDICIATQTSSAMDSGFVFSTTNNFVINTRSTWSNALTSFGVNQAQICRLSCTLNITNLTDTYYLNFKINGGSSRSDLTGASQMLFTRIA